MNEVKVFFIRGFMKSGTNWLGSLLASHREITVDGEFHFHRVFDALNSVIDKHQVYQKSEFLPVVRTNFERFINDSLQHIAEPGAKWVGDRTPHTLFPVLLPDSKHVTIVRDGRDVLVSRMFHLFNNPAGHRLFQRVPALGELVKKFQANPWFFKENPGRLLNHEPTVRESIRLWCKHLDSDRRLLSRRSDLQVKQVRYEDMHQDVDSVRKSLFEFMEVDPQKCGELQGVLKPGFTEERPDQFLRKGKVGDWKNYFNDETKKWFKEEAGEELIRQGYEQSQDW